MIVIINYNNIILNNDDLLTLLLNYSKTKIKKNIYSEKIFFNYQVFPKLIKAIGLNYHNLNKINYDDDMLSDLWIKFEKCLSKFRIYNDHDKKKGGARFISYIDLVFKGEIKNKIKFTNIKLQKYYCNYDEEQIENIADEKNYNDIIIQKNSKNFNNYLIEIIEIGITIDDLKKYYFVNYKKENKKGRPKGAIRYKELQKKIRTILIYHYRYGFNLSRIARILELDVGHINTILKLALNFLRWKYDNEFKHEE